MKKPELDAQLVAESVAAALEKRIGFRRAMKQAVGRTMRLGAGGIKLMCSGRLGGAEIARTEWTSEGKCLFIPFGQILITPWPSQYHLW